MKQKHLQPENIFVRTTVQGTTGIVTIETGVSSLVKANLMHDDLTISSQGKGFITLEIPQVKLWSPDEPNLYRLELLLLDDCTQPNSDQIAASSNESAGDTSARNSEQIADRYELRIGVRVIEMIPNQGMLLNGKKIKIKGFCIHQDAGCLGVAVTPEIWRERLISFKNMGCNAIRPSHHIPASELLDLCDELGLLVYEEPFDKWTSGAYRRYFETEWQRDLEAMIRRDRNHPCVFMWGVGNEVEHQGQHSMLKILKMLKDHLLTLDDTRPISYAMNPHFKYESEVDLSKIEDIQQFVDTDSET